jgi:predicted transcriptional regulator
MITKEKLLLTLKDMPAEFSVEELMDKVLLLNKIETGLRQAEKGDVYTSEEAKRMIREWSK